MSEHNNENLSRWQRGFYWILNNGPAVITVIGSATLAVAASAVNLTAIQMLQAVLALLALIGTSLLTERLVEGRDLRRRLTNIDTRLEEVLVYACDIEAAGLDKLVIRRRDLPSLEERLDGAKQVAISGGSLFRLVSEYQNLFEELLESGCQIRFLTTDPLTPAAESLSLSVVYESNNVEEYKAQMRTALASLTSLARRHPEVCQVKVFGLAPPFSLMVVDRGGDSSTIQVEIYPFRTPARNRPMMLINKDVEPRLHAFFSSQFELLWESSFSKDAGERPPTLHPDPPQESEKGLTKA